MNMEKEISIFFVVLLIAISLTSDYASADSDSTTLDKIPPLDGTMELYALEKTKVKGKLAQSPLKYQNNIKNFAISQVPPDKIKFKLWRGGTNYEDINITKRNESTYAYIYVQEGLLVDNNVINSAKTYIDDVYPRKLAT